MMNVAASLGQPDIDYGDQFRAGIIVPSGNVVAEAEIRAMLPRGVAPLFTRLALRGSSEAELIGMLSGLEGAAGLLADAKVSMIIFHCTAVSTFAPHLAGDIRTRIERASGITAFATSDAILEAVKTLNMSRLSLLTPYIEPVHRREVAFLASHDIDVVDGGCLGIDTNAEMATLTPLALLDWVARHTSTKSDGCFLSCTAIRSAGIISRLEQLLARPVITSNQAMVWHLLQLAGISKRVEGFGSLLGDSRKGIGAR
jgi:maleate cis-trans isomerase